MADALAKKEISSVELTQAHLDQIEKVDGKVKAFLHVDKAGALAQAKAADEARKAEEEKAKQEVAFALEYLT
mgnify:CR=1 FL=1